MTRRYCLVLSNRIRGHYQTCLTLTVIYHLHSKLSKTKLMQMVKFGVDQIISSNKGTYTDEDIDVLIAKGKKMTNEIQAKLQQNAQHNLATFALSGKLEGTEGKDTFDFAGENYRDKRKKDGSLLIVDCSKSVH
jgi:hypothetical protein